MHVFLGHRAKAAALAAAVVHVVGAAGLTRVETGAGLLVLAPVRTQLVVLFPLGGVAEDFVRLVDLLEARLCRFVVRVDVGMMLARQFAVRVLQFLLGSGLRYSERRVVVLEIHRLVES